MRAGTVDDAVAAIAQANVDVWVCRDLADVDARTRSAMRSLNALCARGLVRDDVVAEVAAMAYENLAGVARHQGAPRATAAYATAASRLLATTRHRNLDYKLRRLDIAIASVYVRHGPLASARYLVRRNGPIADSNHPRLRIEQRAAQAQLAVREGEPTSAAGVYAEHSLIRASDAYDSLGMRALRRLDLARHLIDANETGAAQELIAESEELLRPTAASMYGAAQYGLHVVSALWCLQVGDGAGERHLEIAAALADRHHLSRHELTRLTRVLIDRSGGASTAGPAPRQTHGSGQPRHDTSS